MVYPTKVTVTGKMEIIDKSKKGGGVSAGLALLNNLPMGLGSSLGGLASAGIDSEKEIILSNTLVRNVVKELKLHTEYGTLTFNENKLPAKQAKAFEGDYTLKVTIMPPTVAANAFIGRTTLEPPSMW